MIFAIPFNIKTISSMSGKTNQKHFCELKTYSIFFRTELSPEVFNELLDFLAGAESLKEVTLHLPTNDDQMNR